VALSVLVPALAAGLHQTMLSTRGLAALLSSLGGGGHQRYVDDASTLTRPEAITDGNDILGDIFGSKAVSRLVAGRAAELTGIGASVLERMLPVVAAMAMGALAKEVMRPVTPRTGFRPGGNTLLGMLSPMLESNCDGSMGDVAFGLAGRVAERSARDR
jgi:hypothetical protein